MSPAPDLPEVRSLDWLEMKIADRDESLTCYANRSKRAAFLFTMLTAVLSALTTAFIAIAKILASDTRAENSFLGLAAISSAFVVVVNAWDAFFGFRRTWILNVETRMRLRELNADLQFAKTKNAQLSQGEVDAFYGRFMKIMTGAHVELLEIRKQPIPQHKV